MEYYNGKLCISMHDLVNGGIMSVSNYKKLSLRDRLKVARRGGGARGNYALVVVDSLPDRFKEKVYELYPDDNRLMLDSWVRSNYELDCGAVIFFNDVAKTGVCLNEDKKLEYIVNASVLNCCIKLYKNASVIHRLMGTTFDWTMMTASIDSLRRQFGHTLPASTLRFRKKVIDYKREGYSCLISGKFGNQSARKK
jgi:hypothetical protein